MTQFQLFATAPKGLELLLADELRQLGATEVKEKLAGVSFFATLEVAYKICLWSRLANRVLLQLASLPAATPEELYQSVQSINWQEHLSQNATLAVNFATNKSAITHTLYGAQKVKDAIVDQLRDKTGQRPSVDKQEPDVSVFVYCHRDIATINIDLSGDSLHKRGYRLSSVTAPLKENLAAAILLRANWPALAKEKATLLDPMCGSGTILIEAALMAANIAPGLDRDYFGFLGWKKHQPALWRKAYDEALKIKESGLDQLPTIVGYDHDARAIKSAFENIERAGLTGKIHVEKRELDDFQPNVKFAKGLVITNPPYGERLGEIQQVKELYKALGVKLKQAFTGWQAAVITGNPDLGKEMGIRAKKRYAFFNGAIPSQLLLFDVSEDMFIDNSDEAENARLIRKAKQQVVEPSQALTAFINRVKKNLKHQQKLAKRAGSVRYKVYDNDLPDYAFSIEVVAEKVYVHEYEAPRKINAEKVTKRRLDVLAMLPELMGVDPGNIYFTILPRD